MVSSIQKINFKEMDAECITLDKFMKVNLRMAYWTDTPELFSWMELFTKVNTKKAKNMAKENSLLQMEMFKKGDGKTISLKDNEI